MKQWMMVAMVVGCLAINSVPAPTQEGDDGGGGGCRYPGHLSVTPTNVLPTSGDCQTAFTGMRTVWVSKTPDYTYDIRCAGSHPPPDGCPYMPVTCAGDHFWADVHADKFDVEGVYLMQGTITFNENALDYLGFMTTEYASTSSYVEHNSFGVLTLNIYPDPPYVSPSLANLIATRLHFYAKGALSVPSHISVSNIVLYTNAPNPPFHQIPLANYCRRDSDVALNNP